jgi:hypothetical protein
MATAPPDARHALLSGLIDDAGLFPPASLPLEEAAASHERSRTGEHRFMLGRFICPASRLEQLRPFVERSSEPWRISALLDLPGEEIWHEEVGRALEQVRSFVKQTEGAARVDLVETRPSEAALDSAVLGVRAFCEIFEWNGLEAFPFLEIPFRPSWKREVPTVLEAFAGAPRRMGAKLRCGGASADAFPSPEQVALFIDGCRRLGLPMKATAGLHHPFRHLDPETGFTRHGFLNLVTAAVFGREEEIVADQDGEHFSLSEQALRWRDLEAGPQAITATRRDLFISYGSCSFVEPVADLVVMGVLPLARP